MTQNQGSGQKKSYGALVLSLVEDTISGITALCQFLALTLLISELMRSLNLTRSGPLVELWQLSVPKEKMSGKVLLTMPVPSLKDTEPGTRVFLLLMNSPTSSSSESLGTSSSESPETEENGTVVSLPDRNDPEKYPWK